MKITILFFVLCFSVSVYAQEAKKNDFVPPMMIHGIGISFQSFDGLNSRIANLPQYKQLRDYSGTLDIGSIKVHNRFVSDIDLTAGSSMSGDRDKRSSTIRYLGAGIDFGYDLIPDYRIMFYPMAGIGVQGYEARFYKDNSAVLFDDVLQSPGVQNNIRPVNFTNSFFTYRLGLGFALRSPKYPGSVGMQAGYTGSFKDRSWKSSDSQTLSGAPADDLSQFHVSFILSGGIHSMRRG